MYNLREDHDLQAKFASLARIKALELKKSGQLKYVQDIICQICETNEHSINDCPTLPSLRECLHEQAHALNNFQRPNHNPYWQTYNSGYRNHPKFSWKSGNNNAQTSQPSFQAHYNFKNSHGYAPPYAPPHRRNLDETLHAFIEKYETINIQLARSMTEFKDTFAKFTSALSFQEKGKFPSQPQQNPKGQYNANASIPEANTWIKSNQSSLFAVVRLLKNSFLNLVRKMMSQSLRVRKGLNLNIAKKRLIPRNTFISSCHDQTNESQS
jgi:hypothetical protein